MKNTLTITLLIFLVGSIGLNMVQHFQIKEWSNSYNNLVTQFNDLVDSKQK